MSKVKRIHGALAFAGVSLFFAPISCKPTEKKSPVAAETPLARQLAGARIDSAKIALDQHRRDEALLLLVSALKADPKSTEALHQIRTLLAETRWHYPAARLETGMPLEQLFVSGNSLWTSVSTGLTLEGFNATARWNLETLAVESVLFPRRSEITTAAILSPTADKIIIQRGQPGDVTTLLCDAVSLKPIGELPAFSETSAALTVFSDDGLLFANPETSEKSTTWHLRDTGTGEIIRSASAPLSQIPLAARFEGDILNVSHTDGTALKIPLSPVDPAISEPAAVAEASPRSAFDIEDQVLVFADPASAPIRSDHQILKAILEENRVLFGSPNGEIEVFRPLPPPRSIGRGAGPLVFDPANLDTLSRLAEALTGLQFDEETRIFKPLSESQRRNALTSCDRARLGEPVPGLDFLGVLQSIVESPVRFSEPNATFPLRDRIARADRDRPRYLALSVTEAAVSSPTEEIEAAFRERNSEKIVAAIKALPSDSPALATAFSLALESDEPGWIATAVATVPDAPPVLRQLALSKIAWLQGAKAESMAFWRDGFPDMKKIRRTEDWDGWEAIDFSSHFDELFGSIRSELTQYEIHANFSPEQLQIVSNRLLNPSTRSVIGKERHAEACLAAAAATAELPDQLDLTFKLTAFARLQGAPPSACLRVEAAALTRAGDFLRAHDTWVSLISDYPTEVQEAGDYAEAAYTAFENGNSEMAMAILGTGVFRFPNDPNFAYRAGWISLLTARWPEAYEFLRTGERIGFPEEKLEKATALLAIAASEVGNVEAANDYFQQLLAIDPKWSQPVPPKADGWPEELIVTLNQISEPPKALPVEDF